MIVAFDNYYRQEASSTDMAIYHFSPIIDWQTSVVSEREAYAEYLLDFLDQKNDASRLSFAHQLIYLAQGKRTFMIEATALIECIRLTVG